MLCVLVVCVGHVLVTVFYFFVVLKLFVTGLELFDDLGAGVCLL